jgi:UDP-N-acetylglucosamine acyltransferase
MPRLHPTAIIDPAAEIEEGAVVGPFCVVGPHVRLAARVVLDAHAVVTGRTAVGAGCRIGSFAVVGGAPQDRSHEGPVGPVTIGTETIIREHVTIHGGSSGGRGSTRIGDGCLLMVGSHVGHDTWVGDRSTLVNGVMLAGHVDVGADVFVGGASTVHQFVRLGDHSHVGGSSAVERDVVPWGLALGNRAVLRGPNLVGMKRAGLSPDVIRRAQALWRDVFEASEAPLRQRLESAEARADYGPIGETIFRFLERSSRRGLIPLASPRSSFS